MKLPLILQYNSIWLKSNRMKGKEANFLAKAHILSMYIVNIRDSGEIFLAMQLLGWGVQEGTSVKPCKVLGDKVRKNAYTFIAEREL